ncbi:unnamed protein product [Phytomonas sp. Hart1]|nr:unnamed protein product [Phytomonas sp. Hart1]|eukprot:CCW71854.1 unnamed protein product [Phytomonas sp. isolate Hart1]
MEENSMQELVCFQESDIEFDCRVPILDNNNTNTTNPRQTRRAVRRGSCSRVQRIFWKVRNLVVAYKEVVLWREDCLTDVTESSRVIRQIQAKRREGGEADACPYLLLYYALRVMDTHHYQWLMEWVEDSLLDLIKNKAFKKEVVCGRVARQLVEALRFLHVEVGLVHGDVSLANILVLSNPGKVAENYEDRGEGGGEEERSHFITRLGDLEACSPAGILPKCFHGTFLFAAPEALAHRVETADFSVDVWSVGIVVCMLLSGGKHPFLTREKPTFWDILDSLNNAKTLNLRAHFKAFLPGVSEAAIEFICGCLSWEPAERLSTTQLLQLPWLSQCVG